jgi:2-polyprenyl-3-methyl-5-hydroxy-6-metoxy-1,4-benzoquinol methylase
MEPRARTSPDRLSPQARRVAERFAHLREPGGEDLFDALAAHFEPLADNPSLPLYFEFAVTTNRRGRTAAERISRFADPGRRRGLLRKRARALDVGCAYGGFLVALAERGARVTGIELDGRLLALAAINLRERGIDAGLVQGDATRAHPGFEGRFDIILANDVVEHVPRLEPFLRNLRDWLRADGIVYLEIPNGAHPAFVRRDGHHERFGITLLDFPDASRYLKLLDPPGSYDTYNYLGIAAYRELFASCGLSVTVLAETLAGASVEGVESQLAALESGLATDIETVPEDLRPLVRERVEAYLARVRAAPRVTEDERRRYLLEYGPSFWMVLASRL